MAKVCILGSCGYIGSVLTPTILSLGHHVVGVDNLRYQNAGGLLGLIGLKNFTFHKLDVCDHSLLEPLLAEADVVIPLAAIVGAPACDRHPENARRLNSHHIRDLVGSLSKSQRVIYPHTNSGYGQTPPGHFAVETDELKPLSHYAQTKGEGEKYVLDHPQGVSLRLATVFGLSPRMRFDLLVNNFTEELMDRKSLTIFQPNHRRNFVHVRDVTRAFTHVMRGWNKMVGVYNVGLPSANLTKMELANQICDVVGLDQSVVKEGDGADSDSRDYLVSSLKLGQTGWMCMRTLKEGIEEVAAYCRVTDRQERRHMRNV